MTTRRTLTITLQPDCRAALRRAGKTARADRYQGETLNFQSPGVFFGKPTERHWALVTALLWQGAMAVRELARRVGRDVQRVHEAVQVWPNWGRCDLAATAVAHASPYKRHVRATCGANIEGHRRSASLRMGDALDQGVGEVRAARGGPLRA